MKARLKPNLFCSNIFLQNIFMKIVNARKVQKKSGVFSNSIFEPYRAPAVLRLETLKTPGAQLQSFIYHP